MEEKDYSRPPAEGENQHDDGSVKESDLASYYAAAASAAASGHEFREENTTEDASDEATSSVSGEALPDSGTSDTTDEADSADTPDTAKETAGGEIRQNDEAGSSEEGKDADISEDGSPHGPLDFFADQKEFDQQSARQDEEKEEETESATREPVPPYENTPAYAAFQAPEKTEDKDDDDTDDAEDDEPMSILGHLNELRRRLFRIVIIVILGFVAFYGVSEPLYGFLSAPLQACMPEGSKLIYTSPQGAFFTYMKVALVASLFGTSPFSFYQLWAFIAPGLYREEKKAILPLAFFSSIFFLAGAAFCFFLVFPIAFQFFMGFATDTIVPMISVEEYLSFALKLLLAFGLVFEMPLFAYFLSRFGLLTPEFMRRTRRYAILVIFIVAAILTPPDVFSQCLMALPMLVLYEVSIYVSAMAYKKKENKTEPQPDPDDEDDEDEDEEEKQ